MEDDLDFDTNVYDGNFKDEINVFERIGMPGIADILMTAGNGMNINRLFEDPFERFAVQVNAISLNINGVLGSKKLHINDIKEMIEKAKDIKNIEYKNPTAYILGYIASKGGKKIESSVVSDVLKNILSIVDDNSIKAPDVIRYARNWVIMNKLQPF